MTRGKAEDAGGLTPAKDDNAAPYHFDRRTLPIFKCVDYKNSGIKHGTYYFRPFGSEVIKRIWRIKRPERAPIRPFHAPAADSPGRV